MNLFVRSQVTAIPFAFQQEAICKAARGLRMLQLFDEPEKDRNLPITASDINVCIRGRILFDGDPK